MIYGLFQIIQEDAVVLTHWIKKTPLPTAIDGGDPQHRTQVAAFRMLACTAMAFGTLWTLSLAAFIIKFPLRVLMELAAGVGIYTLGHDVFVMSQNSSDQNFRQTVTSKFSALIRGQASLQEDHATQFTRGTFLQPVWMWAYAHRNTLSTIRGSGGQSNLPTDI